MKRRPAAINVESGELTEKIKHVVDVWREREKRSPAYAIVRVDLHRVTALHLKVWRVYDSQSLERAEAAFVGATTATNDMKRSVARLVLFDVAKSEVMRRHRC